MRRRWLVLALLLSLALNAGLVTAILMRHRGHREPMRVPDTGLPKETQAKLEENFKRFHGRMEQLKSQMRTEREKLLDLLASPAPSQEEIQAQQQTIQAISAAMTQTITEHFLEQKKLLTPEQQKKFFDALRRAVPSQGASAPPKNEENRP
jgi:Spy/CpxP family protein refolding chaperone